MKLLYVCTVELSRNGIVTWLMNYCDSLMQKNLDFEISLVTPYIADQDVKEAFKNINVSVIEIKNRKSNPLVYMAKLYRIIKKNQFDIVHIHGNSAILVIELLTARLADCQVRIVHSHNTKSEYPFLDKMCRPLFNRLYTHAIACGDEAGRWLFKNKPFTVMRNGVNLKKFEYNSTKREDIRTKLKINNELLIGHVGLFEKVKNHQFLIIVMNKLKQEGLNIKLLLIGDGSLKNEILQMIDQFGLNEDVLLVENTNNVCDYFQAMDIFVLPSIYEGLPFVLIEAQASGTTCLVSKNISNEANLSENFIMIELDQNIWIENIKYYYENIPQRNKHQVNKENLKKFDIEQNAAILLDFYNNCIK